MSTSTLVTRSRRHRPRFPCPVCWNKNRYGYAGYPMEMVLAEKIVTALQRGQASTRWRDFGDIYQLTGHHVFHARKIRQALQAVADYRGVELSGLDDALEGYAEIGQPRWAPWRTRLQLTEILPADFGDALGALRTFAGPILTRSVADTSSWDPVLRGWSDAS